VTLAKQLAKVGSGVMFWTRFGGWVRAWDQGI